MYSLAGNGWMKVKGRYPSGQRELTVNQLSYDFGGSNPSLPTKKMPQASSHECCRTFTYEKWKIRSQRILPTIGRPIQLEDQLLASIAQAVERILGKNEVMGSSPIGGSRNMSEKL